MRYPSLSLCLHCALFVACAITLLAADPADAVEDEAIVIQQDGQRNIAGKDGVFDQSSGSIATVVARSLLNDGMLEVTGGAGAAGFSTYMGWGGVGVYLSSGGDPVTNSGTMTNNGTAIFKGGRGGETATVGMSAYGAHAIEAYLNAPLVNTGSLTAIGGDGGAGMANAGSYGGHGMYIMSSSADRLALVNEGTTTVIGGNGAPGTALFSGGRGGDGVYTYRDVRNTGTFVAMGGLRAQSDNSGAAGNGLSIYTQKFINTASGLVFATGGTFADIPLSSSGGGMGIYVSAFENHGTLNLLTGHGAPAVFITGTPDNLPSVFKSGSVLGLDGGRFVTSNEPVTIETGARVRSLGASSLGLGESLTYTNFIDTTGYYGDRSGALISGEFTPEGTDTLKWNLFKNADGSTYSATVTRRDMLQTYVLSDNSGRYVRALESALTGQTLTEQNAPWFETRAMLDEQTNASLQSLDAPLARRFTPQATTTAMRGILRSLEVPSQILGTEMRNLNAPQKLATTAAVRENQSSGASSDASAPRAKTFWVQPFYMNGQQRGSGVFADMSEDFLGLSLGFAVDTGPVVLSLAGHYVGADYFASDYTAKGSAFGLNAGVGRRFAISPNVNPWVEVRLGYNRHTLYQTRKDMDRRDTTSDPGADIFNAGLLINNDFRLGSSFTLTPFVGLDYAHLRMDEYSESGSPYALKVSPDGFASLRGSAGLSANWRVLDALDITARASYGYEMGNTYAQMTSHAETLPSLRFTTKGEDLDRSTGTLGAGLAWKPSDAVTLALDYNLNLGDKYTGHQVMGVFKMTF